MYHLAGKISATFLSAGMELLGKAHRKANYDSFEDYFKSLCLPEDSKHQ